MIYLRVRGRSPWGPAKHWLPHPRRSIPRALVAGLGTLRYGCEDPYAGDVVAVCDRHLAQDKPVWDAIRDGAGEIATPALVSTLCLCIVFVPIFLLAGVGKYLFAPLARIPGAPEALRHPHLVRLIPILEDR